MWLSIECHFRPNTMSPEKRLRKKAEDRLENQSRDINTTFKKFEEKIDNRNYEITQAYKDEVSKGLEKLEMSVQIGLTKTQ